MRYGGRDTSVIESRGHRSYYKQYMQSSISCMRNLFVKSRKFAWISFAEARKCSRFFQRALGDLHFSTLSTLNNKRNQRKSWRVNFHDHHRCASRSHNETKLKRFGITATTAIGWGQEEGMDEDTAMWKEGVRVRSFMEAQKGKKILMKGYLAATKRLRASIKPGTWNILEHSGTCRNMKK